MNRFSTFLDLLFSLVPSVAFSMATSRALAFAVIAVKSTVGVAKFLFFVILDTTLLANANTAKGVSQDTGSLIFDLIS